MPINLNFNRLTTLFAVAIVISSVNCSSGVSEKGTSDEQPTFSYTPTKPVNGKLKGVVELGASGFNSFVINLDQDKNWELVNAEWGTSSVVDGLASDEDLRSGLREYVASMLENYSLKKENIHVVVSSGAQKEAGTPEIVKGFEELGFEVHKVTVEKEGMYGLKAALPKKYYENSFVMDLGSGNTKISWVENDAIVAFKSPGSKYYKKGISDALAFQETSQQVQRIPESKRDQCFIIGGVAFKLANRDRKENERFTTLRLPSKYNADGEKEKAGLNILEAVVEATGCKTYIFDWNANFTIGYLLEQEF